MNGNDWRRRVWLPWETTVRTLTIVVSVILVLFVATRASSSDQSGCVVTTSVAHEGD